MPSPKAWLRIILKYLWPKRRIHSDDAEHASDMGLASKILHWIGALAVFVLLLHGWWMVHMAPQPERFANYVWHAALGYDLLALLVLRVLWRWMNPV